MLAVRRPIARLQLRSPSPGGAVAADASGRSPLAEKVILLRLRRHAARPRRQVRGAGRDADHDGAHGRRRQGPERPRFRASPEHRRRLVRRSRRARGRASTARRTTPSIASARATSTTGPSFATTGIAPGGHDRAGRRARGQEGRRGRVGRGAHVHPSSAGAGHRLPELLLRPRRPDLLRSSRASRPALPRSASSTRSRRSRPPSGWTNTPAGRLVQRRRSRRC